MADRLLMEAGKLIVSKEGKDASDPALTPGDMMFNSDWLFTGTIIAAGVYIDSSNYQFGPESDTQGYRAREYTDDTFAHVVNFPTLPYVPTVLLMPLGDSRYWNEFGMLLMGCHKQWGGTGGDIRDGPITVSNSQITIPRLRQGNSPYRKYREDFLWVVMGM